MGSAADSENKMKIESLFSSWTEEDDAKFRAVFPTLVKKLTGAFAGLGRMPMTLERLQKLLHYNVPHGKLMRGRMVVETFRAFSREKNPRADEQETELSFILGWCVELAFALVADDLMDGSTSRRGQMCWYLVDSLGLEAVNDSFMLEQCIYVLLREFFGDKPYYSRLLDLFHRITFITCLGQSLDTQIGREKQRGSYNIDNCESIIKCKTSFYSFCLPVSLGITMAEPEGAEELLKKVESVLLNIGHLFQVQDDFLDCFGDEVKMGKNGTDIADGKCSWPLVTALKVADEKQRETLLSSIGHNDPEKIAKVKSIYTNLGLPQYFDTFEKEQLDKVLSQLNSLSLGQRPVDLFRRIVKSIAGRQA